MSKRGVPTRPSAVSKMRRNSVPEAEWVAISVGLYGTRYKGLERPETGFREVLPASDVKILMRGQPLRLLVGETVFEHHGYDPQVEVSMKARSNATKFRPITTTWIRHHLKAGRSAHWVAGFMDCYDEIGRGATAAAGTWLATWTKAHPSESFTRSQQADWSAGVRACDDAMASPWPKKKKKKKKK